MTEVARREADQRSREKGKAMGMISKKASGIPALGVALGAAAMMMAQPVSAAPMAIYNFDALAVQEEAAWSLYDTRNVDGGSFDGPSDVYTKGGIGVEATADNTSTATPPPTSVAYLDDTFNGIYAGLGVCSSGINASDDCIVSSDDNTGAVSGGGERLKLSFTDASDNPLAVILSNLRFKNSEHYAYTGSVVIGNGSGEVTANVAGGSLASIAGLGAASMWTFAYDTASYTSTTKVGGSIPGFFYLAGATATVPLPAGLLLLGSALGGLGLMKRRRKAA